MPAAVTPAGVRDGDPAALAGLCAARGPSVVAYCRHVAGEEGAGSAAADAFARFRAAVVATDDLGDVNPEALLVDATRHASAGRAVRAEQGPCADVPALLAARAGKTIAADELERLEQHLAQCAACRAPVARFEAAERAYRDPPDPAMELTTVAQIMAAMVAVAPTRGGFVPPHPPPANGNGHRAAPVGRVPAASDVGDPEGAEAAGDPATEPERIATSSGRPTEPEGAGMDAAPVGNPERADIEAASAIEPEAIAMDAAPVANPEPVETPPDAATAPGDGETADEPVIAAQDDRPLAEPATEIRALAVPQPEPQAAQTAATEAAPLATPPQPAPAPKPQARWRRPRGAARAAIGTRLPRPQRPAASQAATQAQDPRRGRGRSRRARPLPVVLPIAVVLVALLVALMVSGVVGGSDPASSPRVEIPADAPAPPAKAADVVVVPGAKEASADEIEKAKERERERAKRRREAAAGASSSSPASAPRPVTAPPAPAAAPPPPPPAPDTRQNDGGGSRRVDSGNGATGAEQIPPAEDTSEVPDLAPPPEPATAP